MKPGEKVVAVTNFRGIILVFGEFGTVLTCSYEEMPGLFKFENVASISQS